MTYLLYMKRSFTRSPRRHAVLFAVMTCAFLLPLLICIYRDSNAGARGNIFLPVLWVKPITLGTQRKRMCHILRVSADCLRPFIVTAPSICVFCRMRTGEMRRV